MSYSPSKRPITFLQRQENARRKEEDRLASWHDVGNTLIRRIRSEQYALGEVGAEAVKVFERENKPLPLPPGANGGHAHPQRVARIARLILEEGWSTNPAEPIESTRSLSEIAASLGVETQAALDAANVAYAEFLAEKRRLEFEEAGKVDPETLPTPCDLEPAVVSENEIANAVATFGEDDVVLDEAATDAELIATRRRGRPKLGQDD